MGHNFIFDISRKTIFFPSKKNLFLPLSPMQKSVLFFDFIYFNLINLHMYMDSFKDKKMEEKKFML
jgi:hypothetical protein